MNIPRSRNERSSYSLVPIFVLAGGVNVLVGVLLKLDLEYDCFYTRVVVSILIS